MPDCGHTEGDITLSGLMADCGHTVEDINLSGLTPDWSHSGRYNCTSQGQVALAIVYHRLRLIFLIFH